MRKYLSISFLFLFIIAASFFGGAFVAKRSAPEAAEKNSTDVILEENQKNIPENNDSIEIVEKNTEENTASEVDFSFAILGDTQYFKPGANGGFQKAVSSIKKINPNLVFSVGDLTSCDGGSECDTKYNNWKNVLGNFSSKTYVIQGNHDRVGKEKADSSWQKIFTLPTNGPAGFSELVYSFDYENSHFIVLDSDKPKENDINSTQLDWLEGDLNKNTKENIFVFFHEPAYPTNSKIGESLDVNAKDRDRLWNIMTSHKVTAVFSGHEHIQSRRKVNGLYQFVFGNTDSFDHLAPKSGTAEYSYIGQAFGMVEINGKEITVKTYSVQGKLLDSFALAK
ncbi:MAG: metallophosphoesterase [Parcubacteria group bacterium]|jgi:predicted MPP superfamily phosphohydrolase